MTFEQNGFGQKLDAKWVKAESGATYLCPAAILEFVDELTEEELKSICVQTSMSWEIN